MLGAQILDLLVFTVGSVVARAATRLALLLARRMAAAPSRMRSPSSSSRTVAFLVPRLPDLSHTFVYREVLQVLAHVQRQRRVLVVALEEGSYSPLHPEAKALRRARNPTGRFGRPEDVVYLALYLASDESSWTNGAIISADGGITANYF